MFDRKSAFSMTIRDPENPDDKSRIVRSFPIGEDLLLIFKETSIHRMLTADTIDPENSDPSTRHSSEILYSVGAAHSCVARMILQFKEIISLWLRNSA